MIEKINHLIQILKNKTILIVEDDLDSFSLLSKYLIKTDVKILYSPNGAEAIETIKNNKNIDLVLMDINLPVMDGYDATREIKKIRKDLPVISQTANAMLGDRKKSLDAGCDEYMAKPIRRMELLETIQRVLAKYGNNQ